MKPKIRILHIDDNLLDRQIIKNVLQKEPGEFEVIETESRPEFELHLNKSDFDLILSEINIPGLEGLNVLQIVKEKKPEIPVIIVTGKGSEEIAAEAMKLGAADYVIKSEKHIQNLSPTIRKVIENRKIQDDHKATLIALRKSEKLYRNLFESMLNGFAYCKMIFDKDMPLDFIYLKVNTAFESLTGLSNVVGKKVSEVIPGIRESDPELFKIYGRVSLTGKPETFEIYVQALKLWFLISVYSPQKEHFVAIFDVITKRKLADELLIASEIRYRRLFESARDGILILDAETGMIVDVNPYLVELLGYSTEQFHGKKIWEIGIFSDIIANKSKFLELQQNEYVRYDDLPLKTIDGRQIAVEFVSNVYEVNNQRVIQCNIRDITKRKLIEKEIRDIAKFPSENPSPILRISHDGTLLYVNEVGMKQLQEWKLQTGQPAIKMLQDVVFKTLDNGEAQEVEFEHKEKVFLFYVVPYAEEGYTNMYGRDITENKRAEETLRLSEEKFRVIFDNASDGMFLVEQKTRKFFMCNAMCARMLNYTQEEFLNLDIADLHLAEDLPFIYEQIGKISTGEAGISGDIRFRRKNGDIFFADLSPTLITIDDKKYLLILFKDITERKKSEEQQIVQTTALEATAISVVITDAEGTITWVNNAFTKMTGYSKEEAIGKNPGILKSGKHNDSFYKNMWDTVKAGNVWRGEVINKRKDNSLLNDEMTITPVRDTNGIVRNFIALKQDITARKRAEAEIRNLNANLELKVEERTKKLSEVNINLNESKAQAERANQAKSEFLSNMSHEIRTPMNAVLGYAELLNNILEDKTQKDYIKSIISSGKTLLTIINDILDLSKIEAGKLELTFDYVNTHSFFSEFERIFSWKITEKGLTFILDIASGIPAEIYVDETRLRQILLNIIGNAVKFTQKGHIKLKIYIENPQIVKLPNEKTEEFIDLIIEVEDTGIGISKEFRDQIFEPFSQEQHKNQFGGTGLGLTITRRLLSLMNGTISLQSKLNKGSTFQLKIPSIAYLHDFERKTNGVQIDPTNIQFGKATILIADDVAHNRKYFVSALKNTNIEIVEAGDGLTAYKLAKAIVPDLIITDLRMPKLDGFGLLKKIQGNANLRHIPVIAYTASAMKKQKEHICNCQFSGLLIKPVRVTDLYIELMNYLSYTSTLALEKDHPTKKELIKQIIDIQGLVLSLETVYTDVWKKFEVRQPMEEVKEFGGNLENLGNVHNAEIIKEYGNELMLAAESFNIESILKLLNKYQGIVKEIKEYQSTN